MQVTKEYTSPTNVRLKVAAGQAMLDEVKQEVLAGLAKSQKMQGFREGKAPLNLVEKSVDPALLQTEFLKNAVNRLYADAAIQENVRPVAQPQVNVTKFVPFTTLEIEVTVQVDIKIKLPDYKKIKLAKKPAEVTAKDVDEVIKQLQVRAAERAEAKRPAQKGDEVVIDFSGVDAKTKQAIAGADGQGYPLLLGSNTFIPGFEDNLLGLKTGENKSFTLEFPADYGVKTLQNRKVTFTATVTKISEVKEPAVDDAFAAKVGPFKTVAELKSDIKKQLLTEKQNQANRAFESELVEKIAQKAEVALPEALVEEELGHLENQEKQNVAYRGQTWQEHLKSEGLSEEEHRQKHRPVAEMRVKAGLVLSEIAEQENIKVAPEELEIRLQILKGQYPDPAMQAELDKPETRREIASRLATEKTLAKLSSYANPK